MLCELKLYFTFALLLRKLIFMMYTSNDILPINKRNRRSIFLAGSMDHKQKGSWSAKVIAEFGTHNIFDPTHIHYHEPNAAQMKQHIKWQLAALQQSDIILLNFLENSKSPISFVALGKCIKWNSPMIICPKEFYISSDVHTHCKQYNTPIFSNIKEA